MPNLSFKKEGVNAVDGVEESFLRRYTISEDFRNANGTIEVHLASIDILVSVMVDSSNRINNISTTYLPGKTDQNGTESEKAKESETGKENTPSDKVSRISLEQEQNTAPKGEIIQTESAGNSSSWLEKAWKGFSSAVQLLLKWLYIGIEWPRDINKDMFSRMTITRAEFTCPADGSVNHSLFNLDITDDMEVNTCPVTRSFPLTTLAENDSNLRSEKSQDMTSENNEIPENQTKNDNEKENEPSKLRESFVVFIGHYDNEFEEWPELHPEFAPVEYYSSQPEMLATSPPQRVNDGSAFPDNSEVTQDLKHDDGDYVLWPESAPEFATATASDDYDYTDNAWPESSGNPLVEETLWRESLGVESQPEENNKPFPLENSNTGTLAHVLLQQTKASATVDVITWPDPVYSVDTEMKRTSNVIDSTSNGTFNHEESMCPNHLVDTGYSWIQKDGDGICEALTVGVDSPLQIAPVKIGKGKWLAAKTVINESVMCPMGSNKLETEFCPNKAAKRTPASPWLITRLWNSGMAYLRWPKSSGVPPRPTELPIKIMEVCMAGSNKTGPETKFCALKALKPSETSPWLVTKLWRNCASYVRWPRKSNDVPVQVTGVPVNIMEICMAGSNKSGPETKFCAMKTAKRSPASPWFITRLWRNCLWYLGWCKPSGVPQKPTVPINIMEVCMAGTNKTGPETKFCAMKTAKRSSVSPWFFTRLWRNSVWYLGWRKPSGVPLKPTVPINIMEVCMAGTNKTGPETKFCAMKAAKLSAALPWFTTRMWNKGVDTLRWIKSNETQEKALNLTNYCWESFKTTMINWTWQNTFDVMIVVWMSDYCLVALSLTTGYIKEIIRLLGKQREIRRLEWEEEERERQLRERERERELELQRQRAAQPKPIWRPKQPKKKRPNYCGRLQKWN